MTRDLIAFEVRDSNKKYLLSILLLNVALNDVDRLTLGVAQQDLKPDLSLSDTQLGFLSGIAFALFYSLMGIRIARWADCGTRVAIISITTSLWSAAVALCGIARNFLQLLLIRVGVATGEAGCVPPAHVVPRHRTDISGGQCRNPTVDLKYLATRQLVFRQHLFQTRWECLRHNPPAAFDYSAHVPARFEAHMAAEDSA